MLLITLILVKKKSNGNKKGFRIKEIIELLRIKPVLEKISTSNKRWRSTKSFFGKIFNVKARFVVIR